MGGVNGKKTLVTHVHVIPPHDDSAHPSDVYSSEKSNRSQMSNKAERMLVHLKRSMNRKGSNNKPNHRDTTEAAAKQDVVENMLPGQTCDEKLGASIRLRENIRPTHIVELDAKVDLAGGSEQVPRKSSSNKITVRDKRFLSEVLQQHFLYMDLSDKERSIVIEHMEKQSCGAGEFIF